ncbi:hypothetical protein SKAU_G00424280 [Synaphobranchus kaupii]|uniref:Pyrin domain-containing protein n=1 Tax=Synaphobranchus kaupii TaxID=118154 RepID=A0A9Q1IAM9_SYNKA|nr:hypothetical protein SKAU_G00424280 [Synaphobranchus kaupii]
MKLKKDEKLKLFQSHLSQYYPECSEREQEDPEALYIVEKMLKTCGSERSLKITLHILRNMKQKDLPASLERDEQHTAANQIPPECVHQAAKSWSSAPTGSTGRCQDNPVFRLACRYNLLDEASTSEENQAMDVGGHPPFVPNWFSSSGRRLGPDLTEPAAELFKGLLQECQQFHQTGGEPVPSVGEYIKARAPGQAQAEWRDDAEARDLRLAMMSVMLKLECSISGTHSMDDVGLGAYGMYKTLLGLDCTYPGGYEGLISCLMTELPKDIVSYNMPVKCVHWNNSVQRVGPCGRTVPVWVECENGDSFPADHVILTVPLGYLKRHQKTLLSPPTSSK